MKMSPVFGQSAAKRDRAVFARISSRFTRKAAAHQPVADDVLALAQYVAIRTASKRVGTVHVLTAGHRSEVYKRDKMREYHQDENPKIPHFTRPQPAATVALFGKNYGSRSATKDAFVCRLGVINLQDGTRLVQAAPHDWEDLSTEEANGIRASLRELFGDGPLAVDLERYATINLGLLYEDGSFREFRRFNDKAFGAELISLLDRISTPRPEGSLYIQIQDGHVQQF